MRVLRALIVLLPYPIIASTTSNFLTFLPANVDAYRFPYRRKEITLERKKAAEERRRLEEEKAKVRTEAAHAYCSIPLILEPPHPLDGRTQGC